IDGLLSGWMLRDHAHIRFFLSAPLEERIRRIAERESKNFEEAKEETLRRERYERERFKRLYGMDLSDFSPYNVILNTTLMDIPSTQQVLFRIVEGYLVSH
ncbi:MAG: cytidylate kinase, partial [Nitrososphaeria archaeon]|nr:cytidylate kinase [Nitrososphaeria archaeon]NIN52365.1 cytidylate kinase [Nitrososphaeria archaeon]NIQ32853.1 cytidylate kinase [Nitrososphaeria archaeon]